MPSSCPGRTMAPSQWPAAAGTGGSAQRAAAAKARARARTMGGARRERIRCVMFASVVERGEQQPGIVPDQQVGAGAGRGARGAGVVERPDGQAGAGGADRGDVRRDGLLAQRQGARAETREQGGGGSGPGSRAITPSGQPSRSRAIDASRSGSKDCTSRSIRPRQAESSRRRSGQERIPLTSTKTVNAGPPHRQQRERVLQRRDRPAALGGAAARRSRRQRRDRAGRRVGVVVDDEGAVARLVDVELDAVGAGGQGQVEGRQRVLGGVRRSRRGGRGSGESRMASQGAPPGSTRG